MSVTKRIYPGRLIARSVAATALAALIVSGTWVMMDRLTDPLPPCTSSSTSVCSGPIVDHTDSGAGKAKTPSPLPPCVTEDSHDCFWDAQHRGNGLGRSFVDIAGIVYYLDGKP